MYVLYSGVCLSVNTKYWYMGPVLLVVPYAVLVSLALRLWF